MVIWEKSVIKLRKTNSPRSYGESSDDDFYGPPCPFIVSPIRSLAVSMEPNSLADSGDCSRMSLTNKFYGSHTTVHYEQNHLDSLPDDMVAECFCSGYLEQGEALSMLLLCKRMSTVAQRAILSLNFSKSSMSRVTLSQIVARFPNLSSLDFSQCSHFTGDSLLSLLPLSKTLLSLRLCGTSITDRDLARYLSTVATYLGGPSRLRTLDLQANGSEIMRSKVTDTAVIHISKCCPSLKILRLGWCHGVSDRSVPSIRQLCHLKELDLSMTSVSGGSSRYLAEMNSLTHLNLDTTNMTDSGIKYLLMHKDKRTRLMGLSIRSIDISLETIRMLARLDKRLSTDLELSKCTDFEVRADLVLDDIKRKGDVVHTDYASDSTNSIWGF